MLSESKRSDSSRLKERQRALLQRETTPERFGQEGLQRSRKQLWHCGEKLTRPWITNRRRHWECWVMTSGDFWNDDIATPVVETRIDSLCPNMEKWATLLTPHLQIWTPEYQIWVWRVVTRPTCIDSQLQIWICRVPLFWILASFPDLNLTSQCEFRQPGFSRSNSVSKEEKWTEFETKLTTVLFFLSLGN